MPHYAQINSFNEVMGVSYFPEEITNIPKNFILIDNIDQNLLECYYDIESKSFKKKEKEDNYFGKYLIDLNAPIPLPDIDQPIELTQSDRIEAAILRLEIKIDKLLEQLNNK